MGFPKGTKLHPKYVGIAQGKDNRHRPKTYVYMRYYDRAKGRMCHWKGSGIWFEGFTPNEVHDLILAAGQAARAEKAALAAKWAATLKKTTTDEGRVR